jgi:hypothetical protein
MHKILNLNTSKNSACSGLEPQEALRIVAAADKVPRTALRTLQQFTVRIPRDAYRAWPAAGGDQSAINVSMRPPQDVPGVCHPDLPIANGWPNSPYRFVF